MTTPARRRRWPRLVAAVLAFAVLAMTAVGAGVNLLLGQLSGNITAIDISDQTGETAAPALVDEETGSYTPLNILLMGSDTRQGKGNKGYGKAGVITGARSDTTILLHVSADRQSAIAVSIPRDTLITLPECKKSDGSTVGGYQARFNSAIEIGGPGCTIKAVEEMTGLDINNFMLVDFGGFKKIVNALDGVEICLTEDVNDKQSGLVMKKGLHVVNGEEALAFVRTRKGLGDGSDTSRIRRQQAFLSSLMRKTLSSGTLLNPAKMLGVLNAATESLTADPTLANVDNLKEIALSLKDLKPSKVTFTTMPWYPSGDGATVLLNRKKAKPIWKAIAADTTWPPAPAGDQPLLKAEPSGIRVNVYNGTTTKGLAKKVARQLKAEGYLVRDTGNWDTSTVTTTTVNYDPDYDVSAKTLIYATSAEGVAKKRQGQAMDLVIGSDYTSVKPVQIASAMKDLTANVNSGDESFCAE